MANFNEQLPDWQEAGIEPPASKKTTGWAVDDKPPAGWLNWFFNRTYKSLLELRKWFDPSTGHGHTGTAGDGPKIAASGLANGAATDTVIGNRTITDTTAPTGDTAAPTTLFSWIGYMIKSITGGATWRTAPGMTIAAIKSILDAAVSIATPSTLIKRDAAGRAKVAAPSASDDIAIKSTVDNAVLALANATLIPAATNLDTMLTEGNFYMTGTAAAINAITNRPVTPSVPFGLQVANVGGTNRRQIYRVGTTGVTKTFIRNYAGSWGAWYEEENTSAKNVASGYAGLDALAKLARETTYTPFGGATTSPAADANNLLTGGVYQVSGSTTNTPIAGFFGMILVFVSGGETHVDASMWTWQLALSSNGMSHVRYKDTTAAWSLWSPLWTGKNDGAGSGMDTDLVRGQAPNTGSAANTIVARDATGTTGVVNLTLNDTGRVASFSAMGASGFGGILQMTSDSTTAGGYGAWVCYNCYYNGTSWVQPRGSLGSFAYAVNQHRQFSWRYAAAGGVDGGLITLVEVAVMNSVGDFSARRFTSTVTTTPPLTVASVIQVPNLNTDLHDGWHASQAATANNTAVRDANKKLAEVAANRLVTPETALQVTQQTVATFTAPVAAAYTVKIYLRVSSAVLAGVEVRYTGPGGAKVISVLPTTLMNPDDYYFIPVMLRANAGSVVSVTANAGSINMAYITSIITEEG